MSRRAYVAFVLVTAVVVVYLFVSAPPPLPEASARPSEAVPIAALFEMCNAENASVRELYTKEIVGAGKAAGLAFDEEWREPGVEAGPLPALFLRETAERLAKGPVRLGLFLGSDFPISRANRFSGAQAQAFEQMRKDEKPRQLYLPDLKLQAAMFPDVAVVDECVDCHNRHDQSPKKDWKLGDVMGATTFTYPASSVSLEEALRVIAALRQSFRGAYAAYADKAKTFRTPPTFGAQWPTNGFYLPTPDQFLERAEQRTSKTTLGRLLRPR